MTVNKEIYKLLEENSHFSNRGLMDKHIMNHRQRNTLTHGCTDVLSEIARITSRYPIGAKECRYKYISAKLDMPLRSVERHIATLKKAGIIKVIRRSAGGKNGQLPPIISVLPYKPELSESGGLQNDVKASDNNDFDSLVKVLENENGGLHGGLHGGLQPPEEPLGEYVEDSKKVLNPTFTTSTNTRDTIKEISKEIRQEFENNSAKRKRTPARYSDMTAEERSKIEHEVYINTGLSASQFKSIKKDIDKVIANGTEIINYRNYVEMACLTFMKNYNKKAEEEEAYHQTMLELIHEDSPEAFQPEPAIDYSKIF
ncbi:hypothetical protein [Listeria booriae]|uniref:hypothetical protein n=1 Tax=Listeria booriae TaxID=1552123 RepID=UPI00162A55BE|nr:hypothetical protein [Listeria booriae]MBC2164935.1 Rrf2 family transcriptional regulator [Listeria booriae]